MNVGLCSQCGQMFSDRSSTKPECLNLKTQCGQALTDFGKRTQTALYVQFFSRDDKSQQLVTQRCVLDHCVVFSEPLLQLINVKRSQRRRRTLAPVVQLTSNLEHF